MKGNKNIERKEGFITAHEYLKKYPKHKITTGCKSIDEILGGGIETGGITELYGEYGVGKTQMSFQLCLNVQLSRGEGGLEGKAAFVDTEGSFNPFRIKQMALALNLDPEKALRNIFYKHAPSLSHQEEITFKLSDLIKRENIKLVVVDSLIHHFRSEYTGRGSLFQRQQRLKKYISSLQRIASSANISVIVTNHVMEVPDSLFNREQTAVGGHILAHIPLSILFIRKAEGNKRIIKLVDSPSLPPGEAVFIINDKGIRDI